jgi:hypothetical protein
LEKKELKVLLKIYAVLRHVVVWMQNECYNAFISTVVNERESRHSMHITIGKTNKFILTLQSMKMETP